MLHKVVALGTYEELKVADKDLGFRPQEGHVFEVSDERLNVLLGNNFYHVPFVRVLEEKKEEPKEEVKEEVAESVEQKPKKRGRKKKE